jgi:serine/threonine protein kinase
MSNAFSRVVADRYRLIEPLGQGGMGRVWKARDEVLHRDVAIKELVPPPGLTDAERQEMRERSLREARAIARLSHPNAVRVFDVLRTDGDPWIVMEYVPSRSLHDVLQSDGPFTPQRAAEIGLGLLGALRAAHRVGVMHRDVKPGNVLLGDDGRVVLTDFGLATVPGDPNVTRTGLVLGSPAYIAPERARDGTAGPQADLWSLGATLYAAVEGQSPYARTSAIATLTALATEPVPQPRNAGPLKGVLAGLLRKDPANRMTAEQAEKLLRKVVAKQARPSLLDGPRWPGSAREGRTRILPVPDQRAPSDRPVSGAPVVAGAALARAAADEPAGAPEPTRRLDRPTDGPAEATAKVDEAPEKPSGTPAGRSTDESADGGTDRADEPAGDTSSPAGAEPTTKVDPPAGAEPTTGVEVPTGGEPTAPAGAATGAEATAKVDPPVATPAPTRDRPTSPAPVQATRTDGTPVAGRAPITVRADDGGGSGAGRKVLVGVLVGVVLVGLVVFLLNRDGGGSRTASDGRTGQPAASASAVPGAPGGSGQPTVAPSGQPSAAPSAAATSAAPPSPSPAASGTGAPVVPAGWRLYKAATFSVPVPNGWSATSNPGDNSVTFSGPQGRVLLVQWGDVPKPDPVADWREQEPRRKNYVSNYQLLSIKKVDYWKTAADWEWLQDTRGVRFQVRNRGFVTASNRSYAIRWEVPQARWDAELADFAVIAAGFRPDRAD